jgi:hypothetical protein
VKNNSTPLQSTKGSAAEGPAVWTCFLLLLVCLSSAGCRRSKPDSEPPRYDLVIPDDVPERFIVSEKDGTKQHEANGREVYASGYQYGWRCCWEEHQKGRVDPRDEWAYTKIIMPQAVGVWIRGYVDGFKAYQRRLLPAAVKAEPITGVNATASGPREEPLAIKLEHVKGDQWVKFAIQNNSPSALSFWASVDAKDGSKWQERYSDAFLSKFSSMAAVVMHRLAPGARTRGQFDVQQLLENEKVSKMTLRLVVYQMAGEPRQEEVVRRSDELVVER